MNFIPMVRYYSKQARIMSKLVYREGKKRKSWHFDTKSHMPLVSSIDKGPQNVLRVAIWNKLFMKHITDLMATGKSSEKLANLGIEVTRVKVGSGMNVVNVFWTSSSSQLPGDISNILSTVGAEIQQELTGLRVVGKVPPIYFQRDKLLDSANIVEALLAKADMGEDYEPRGIVNLKAELGNEGYTKQRTMQSFEEDWDDMPPMRQNVLGLNRQAILERIQVSKKGRTVPKMEITDFGSISEPHQTKPFDFEEFRQFLLQRKITQDRIYKQERRESRNQNFVNETEGNDSYVDVDDLDFIEEDSDEEYEDRDGR